MTQSNPNAVTEGQSPAIPDRLPKLCGADIELGNFILGLDWQSGTCHEASRALLAEIKGVSHSYACSNSSSSWSTQKASRDATDDGYGNGWNYYGDTWNVNYNAGYNNGNCGSGYGGYANDSQDWGRKFLVSNGGCIYIDLGHLEVCLPECLSALDHLAAWHALLRIVREALHRANARLPEGQRIQVLVNNSDGQGNSYGSHLDFLVTRRCFDNLFTRKLHLMLYLAAYQASSIVFTGAGKVGSENGRPAVDFQISQRADFYETLTSVQTTHNRPIVNGRDESLCGRLGEPGLGASGGARMARLHVIFFDNTLCHVSSLLKVGVMQIVLAMIEQGCIQPGLLLDNPLLALLRWSHDPDLRQKARLVCGKDYTAVEVQLGMAELAGRFIAAGRAEGIVPQADNIFKLWTETLEQLKRQDTQALVGKLDWVLKRSILEQAIHNNGLNWTSPQIKYLDQMYSNLDSGDGLYWSMEQAGVVQKLVTDGQVEHLIHEPPADTRAYTRAMVLRGVDSVVNINWDDLRLKYPRKNGDYWSSSSYFDLPMHNPLGFTKAEFDLAMGQSATLPEALKRMGMRETSCFGEPLSDPCQNQTSTVLASGGSGVRQIMGQDVVIRDVSTIGPQEPTEQPLEGDERYGNSSKKP